MEKDLIAERLEYAKNNILPEMAIVLKREHGKKPAPDTLVEDIAINKIIKEYSGDGIISEERSKEGRNVTGKDFEWVIDPLDGTNNFEKKSPYFAVSIAIRQDGMAKGGLIYHVLTGNLYQAQEGKGSFINGEKMNVSDVPDLEDALVSIVSANSYGKNNVDGLRQKIEAKVGDTEQLHCTSLEFAYVAFGVFDGIIKPTKNPWGVGAGLLMVPEAGGKLTTFRKDKLNIHVASNPYIHDALCSIVDDYLKEKKE